MAQPMFQGLREHQVNAVVNGDHCGSRRERGKHVVRRVKQIDTLAPDGEWNGDLLGNGVMSGAFNHGTEIRSQLAGYRGILLIAEENVLGRAIDPGKAAEEIAD